MIFLPQTLPWFLMVFRIKQRPLSQHRRSSYSSPFLPFWPCRMPLLTFSLSIQKAHSSYFKDPRCLRALDFLYWESLSQVSNYPQIQLHISASRKSYAPAPNSLFSLHTEHLSEDLSHCGIIGWLPHRLDTNPPTPPVDGGQRPWLYLLYTPGASLSKCSSSIEPFTLPVKCEISPRAAHPGLLTQSLGLCGWPTSERIISNLFVQHFCLVIHPQTN